MRNILELITTIIDELATFDKQPDFVDKFLQHFLEKNLVLDETEKPKLNLELSVL